MKRTEVDALAREIAVTKYGLPHCLHIPIAARDEASISKYVGEIADILTPASPNRALLVHSFEAPEKDIRLPIWNHERASILHHNCQVWVHVDFPDYRKVYIRAFPEEHLAGLVLDHVMNRRLARLKGFEYLRIVPVSRAANSSSGGLCEKWGVEFHSKQEMVKINRDLATYIQYADLSDIVKMLNIKTGGSLMEAVNEAQSLVRAPVRDVQ